MKGTEDVSKLPQWAQRKIRVLERNLADLKADMDAMKGVAKSDTVAVLDIVRDHRMNLPVGCEVQYMPNIDCPRQYIGVRLQNGMLDLCGTGMLEIRPEVTNHIRIVLENW